MNQKGTVQLVMWIDVVTAWFQLKNWMNNVANDYYRLKSIATKLNEKKMAISRDTAQKAVEFQRTEASTAFLLSDASDRFVCICISIDKASLCAPIKGFFPLLSLFTRWIRATQTIQLTKCTHRARFAHSDAITKPKHTIFKSFVMASPWK